MAQKVVSIEDRIPKLKEKRKKRANRRMAFLLFLFFLLISIIIYFQSPVSKVKSIKVAGNEYVSNEEIIKASGITNDTVVLSLKKEEVRNSLLQLPSIKKAESKTIFPNKIQISVVEYKRIGYIIQNGEIFSLLENGQAVEPAKHAGHFFGPLLSNFSEKNLIKLIANELRKIPDEVRNSISEIIHAPNHTDSNRIILYMNDGNEIRATLRTFAEKMKYYPALVKQLDPDKKGIIDLEVGMFFKSYQSEINGENDTGESRDHNEN